MHQRKSQLVFSTPNGWRSFDETSRIKKAYRKKALDLHPDRNYGNVQETTRLFAEVQSAYEILSDPQERAWYDSHRNVILQGDDNVRSDHFEHDVRVTTTKDIMDWLHKVNVCREYSDVDEGFYNIIRGYFSVLAGEEKLACEWQKLRPMAYPGFGKASDEYDPTVRAFYAAWSSFATRKTFSWADVYHYSEAPDRRTRRLMEKENKRLREEAIREFNDAVRSLVVFVKKRDPRFKPSTQSEVDRQRVLRDIAAAQAARSRAMNRARAEDDAQIPQWAHVRDPKPYSDSDPSEEEPKEIYECVACSKVFKSDMQFQAHEKSKKHIRAAHEIRKEMHIDNLNLNLTIPVSKETGSVLVSRSSTPGHQMDVDHSDDVKNSIYDGLPNISADSAGPASTANTIISTDPDATSTCTQLRSRSSRETVSASSSEDEYPDREHIKSRDSSQQTVAYNELENDEPARITKQSTKTANAGVLNGEDNPVMQPKMGKAKAKRARKSAQQTEKSARANTPVSRDKSS
ncbi:MAG: hypothetical protein Q9219_007096 [cf. Caloplaca sp. 3 TL-2023]